MNKNMSYSNTQLVISDVCNIFIDAEYDCVHHKQRTYTIFRSIYL